MINDAAKRTDITKCVIARRVRRSTVDATPMANHVHTTKACDASRRGALTP